MAHQRLFDTIESVQTKNLTKIYDNKAVVKDLNLTVKGGELLILIGGSGSGKTTTLKMINRLITPDKGSVFINGTDTTNYDAVTLRRNIGYVIQQIGLFPHLSILDNIGLIPKLEGVDKHSIKEKVRTLLNLVDLPADQFIERYPHQLSGGQQQRIGLARALAMDPRLLLMDEPFGALDPILRKQLQEEFQSIKSELNRTIVFVTHDIDEAYKLGDRIGVMDQGKLIQIGTPEELLLNPANDTVANLVDATSKLRHIENFAVKEVMNPLPDYYILSEQSSVEDAIQHLSTHNIEFCLIGTKKHLIGYSTLCNLLKTKDKNQTLKELATPHHQLQSTDSLFSALHSMKNKNHFLSIIQKDDIPQGYLLADALLLKLI